MGARKKIERLTPTQEAELPKFRQRYLEMASSSGRADRAKLEAALADAYAVIDKPAPRLFIFDSPAACMLALKIFEMGAKPIEKSLWNQLGGQLRGQLRDQLGDHLRGQLGGQFWGQFWDQLRGQLRGQLRDQLGDQLRGQLGGQLRGQLRDQLRDQLGGQLWGQLGGQLWDQLGDQLGGQLGGQLWGQLWGQLGGQRIYNPHFLWGSQDLYWIAWPRFAQHVGVKLEAETDKRLDVMERIAEQCEWWWPDEGIVVASEKPTAIRWDEQRRLHCEDAAAVEYSDGYALYAWHGTRLPERWVLERKTIDPTEILKEQNVEMRAAGAACIGWPRMLSALDYRIIDAEQNPEHGELIELKLEGLPRPGRFLKAECPRNGTIVEGVPYEIETVIAAQAWRVGLDPAEFSYPETRT